ncbi:hypothetical protein Trydic_g12950 [Trypoxylus dichotomus]
MKATYIKITEFQSVDQVLTNMGVLKEDGTGQRWIITYCGGSLGFIQNGLLLFKSKTENGDYHDEMNFDNFSKWFKTQLIPNLANSAIMFMENAPYH